MADIKINVDELSRTIAGALEDYSCEVDETIKQAIDKKTDEVINSLKKNPNMPKRTGKYKKGFRKQTVVEKKGFKQNRISNKKYQLTWLLEDPHLIRNGSHGNRIFGKTRGFPHWAPAREEVRKFGEEIKKELQK